MKRVYVQPEVEIISLKLFGSLLDDTNLGAASYMDTTEEYGARQQSNIFEEDERKACTACGQRRRVCLKSKPTPRRV